MNHLLKRFSRDIIGLVWLSTAIFLALSLYSYNPSDPSFNSIGSSLIVKNFCGYIGSFLSDGLYQIFGLASWFLVLAALKASMNSFLSRDTGSLQSRAVWTSLLVLNGASLIALYWPTKFLFDGHISAGGLLGRSISTALIGAFNPVGVAVILWTLTLALIIFYTERSLKDIFITPIQVLKSGLDTVFSSLKLSLVFAKIREALLIPWHRSTGFFKDILNRPTLLTEKAATSLSRAGKACPPDHFIPLEGESHQDFHGGKNDKESGTQAIFGFLEDASSENRSHNSTEGMMRDTMEELSEEDRPRRRVELKKKIQRKIENWVLPKISILEDPPYGRKKIDHKEIKIKAEKLVDKFKQFEVNGEVVGAKPGPAVTMFEFKPNADVKISKITDLADDISLALSSESVRIIAPIPGRDVVGIETSNSHGEKVYLKDILASENFWSEATKLPLAMGCEADGTQKVVDLRRMPHLLVAGTTGSGKSVFVVSMLTGLLFRHSPKTLKLILIDPKQVDLAAFSELPHLIMPPIREPKKAISALKWAIKEMDKRYRSMSRFGARDIESFNKIVKDLSSSQIREHEEANDEFSLRGTANSYYYTEQPYVCIVCEEFGDLMAVDKSNVEQAVVRLAQMARACGIHLMLAMQSPRKDVVTGLIKTNIPGRVSFKVASKMDSRIILDESGAERLLSRGDMLFIAPGTSKPTRHHGPWVTDKEISAVCGFWREQSEPDYNPLAMRAIEGGSDSSGFEDSVGFAEDSEDYDERYDEILDYISSLKEVSASLLQRRFSLGYPRAARIIEKFESEGVVGPANGSKPRQVLINELK